MWSDWCWRWSCRRWTWLFAAVGRPLSARAAARRAGRPHPRRHAGALRHCVFPPDSAVAPLLPLGEARPRVVHVGTVTLPTLYHAISFGNGHVMPLNMWSFARTIHH
jgi:hypothetical protein